jgi:hypothetical protein
MILASVDCILQCRMQIMDIYCYVLQTKSYSFRELLYTIINIPYMYFSLFLIASYQLVPLSSLSFPALSQYFLKIHLTKDRHHQSIRLMRISVKQVNIVNINKPARDSNYVVFSSLACLSQGNNTSIKWSNYFRTMPGWLRIGTGAELLWIWNWTYGFHEMLGNYRVA